MSFRDQLSALIGDDKRSTAEPILESLEKLLNSNAEDIKALKASLREKEGIKPEDFARLEKERDELAAKANEAATILKKLTKERDEATTKAQAEATAVHRLLVDNGLTEALTRAGIRKELLPAARALLKEQGIIGVESEGDVRRAIATVDGKAIALDEYVTKHFAVSDMGKAFIPADGNSGGGAGGPGRIGAPAPDIRSQYNQAVQDGNADLAMALKERLAQARL